MNIYVSSDLSGNHPSTKIYQLTVYNVGQGFEIPDYKKLFSSKELAQNYRQQLYQAFQTDGQSYKDESGRIISGDKVYFVSNTLYVEVFIEEMSINKDYKDCKTQICMTRGNTTSCVYTMNPANMSTIISSNYQ